MSRASARSWVLAAVCLCLATLAQAQQRPVITEYFPANGSISGSVCGPFGIRFEGDPPEDIDALVRVNGDRTGPRRAGRTWVTGDSLCFVPDIPFSAGETVEIRVDGSLAASETPPGQAVVWRAVVWPADMRIDAGSAGLSDIFDEEILSLAPFYPAAGPQIVDWTWGDFDYNGNQEGVLLIRAGAEDYELLLLTRSGQWTARSPSPCRVDNPLSVRFCSLNSDRAMELALLCVRQLRLWYTHDAGESPVSSEAEVYEFPAGFLANAMLFGDVNADGWQDVVILGTYGLSRLVYLNNGDGSLQEAIALRGPAESKVGALPLVADLGDLDGDGLLDLAWSADFQDGVQYQVSAAAGLGDGGFAPSITVAARTENYPFHLSAVSAIAPAGPHADLCLLWPWAPDSGANIASYSLDGFVPRAGGAHGAAVLSSRDISAVIARVFDDGADTPEILFCDPQSSRLGLRELSSGSALTWPLPPGYCRLAGGDLDFDGDFDLVLANGDSACVLVLSTPGGEGTQAPVPVGTECGSDIDFGVIEADCPEACATEVIRFVNRGNFPAQIVDIDLAEDGPFSVGEIDTSVFNADCNGGDSTLEIPVTFCPPMPFVYVEPISVQLRWAGAGIAGRDSFVTCEFSLIGEGGVFSANSGDTSFLDLGWDAQGEPVASGGSVDFGALPALAGVRRDSVLTLVNSGDFDLFVRPVPTAPSRPFLLSPGQGKLVEAGRSETWLVSAAPLPTDVPAGQPYVDIEDIISWEVSAAAEGHCFTTVAAPETLRVRLWTSSICVAPDPNCTGEAVDCASEVTIHPCPGRSLDYCLDPVGWNWPGASVQAELSGLPVWLDWEWIDVEPAGRRLHLFSGTVVEWTGSVNILFSDAVYEQVATMFELKIETASEPDFGSPQSAIGFYSGPGCGCDQALGETWYGCLVGGLAGEVHFPLEAPADGLVFDHQVSLPDGSAFDPAWVSWMPHPADGRGGLLRIATEDLGPLACDAAVAELTLVVEEPECGGRAEIQVTIQVIPELPDLAVALQDVPERIVMAEEFSIGGIVSCEGGDADEFDAELSILDPNGLVLAEQSVIGMSLDGGDRLDLGRIFCTPSIAGQHTLRIDVSSLRDANPDNNHVTIHLAPGSGPLLVRPNVATPNSDGRNDVLYFHFVNQANLNPGLRIFDLGGRRIFETRALDGLQRLGWDGRDRDGRIVQPGSYLYVIVDGDEAVDSGTVGVVR